MITLSYAALMLGFSLQAIYDEGSYWLKAMQWSVAIANFVCLYGKVRG